MKNVSETQGTPTANQESNIARREWVKPAVKAAEVAQATLSGHLVPPTQDFNTCAS